MLTVLISSSPAVFPGNRVLTELVSKMKDMQMDKSELGCLRAIVLFNPGEAWAALSVAPARRASSSARTGTQGQQAVRGRARGQLLMASTPSAVLENPEWVWVFGSGERRDGSGLGWQGGRWSESAWNFRQSPQDLPMDQVSMC